MPAATLHRRLLIATALVLYACVFVAFVLFEVPGLGLGHFFYIPVALLALACGTRVGLVGGVAATGLYTLAIVLTPRLPARDVLTAATAIRFVTYSSCGALVGWFANEHRRHVERLRELAERDFLTGLVNMRVFDEALATRCATDAPFIVLLGDVDNLKEVNDAHGHIAGNKELQRLAQTLTELVGPGDGVARVGGDEFALLTSAQAIEPAELCNRLTERLAARNLQITFGWARYPDDGSRPLELFRKADDRLYAAKLIRRNRRVVQLLRSTH